MCMHKEKNENEKEKNRCIHMKDYRQAENENAHNMNTQRDIGNKECHDFPVDPYYILCHAIMSQSMFPTLIIFALASRLSNGKKRWKNSHRFDRNNVHLVFPCICS